MSDLLDILDKAHRAEGRAGYVVAVALTQRRASRLRLQSAANDLRSAADLLDRAADLLNSNKAP